MENKIKTTIKKIKAITFLLKNWYNNLDKKKKTIIWLYLICGLGLLIGTIYIIVSSVLQADKYEEQQRLTKLREAIESLEEQFSDLKTSKNEKQIESLKEEIEAEFDGSIIDIKNNEDILKSIKIPISDPISE